MGAIVYRKFNGEIPRETPALLPPTHAQLSVNCDFTNGTLRPLKGGTLLTEFDTSPIRGVFSENGLTAYAWNVETLSFASPVLTDVYDRMYYLQPSVGEFRVAPKSGMTPFGPSPSTNFKVGVPRPTVAPTLRLIDRTTLPDYPSITIGAIAWWDYDGEVFSESAVSLTTASVLKQYTFSPPSLPLDPPENVSPVLTVKLTISDNNNSNVKIMSLTCRAGGQARSDALPGTVEMSVSNYSTGLALIELSWGIADTIAYVYTYENTWDEESAPSPPATISRTYLQDVEITGTPAGFTGYRPFEAYNLYRTYGSSSVYIKCLSGASAVGIDTSRTPIATGTTLESTDYFPPVSGLEGMVLAPGGWLISYKDKTLYKSAPYKPHAWPYEEKFPTAIRGVCVGQQSVVVTCADGVYLVPGIGPSRKGYVKLSAPQAGIAQRSMVGVDGAVAYASNDGIVLVTGSVASIEASQRLFSREKWREMMEDILDDYSLRLAYHDGYIVGASNTTEGGFMIRLDEDVGSFTRLQVQFDTMLQLPITDTLYYTVGSEIYRFNDGDPLTFDWWGKDWVFPDECSMGAGYIRADGTINVKIYADGDLLYESERGTGNFRIGPAKRARRWSVRLGGTGTVYELQIAQSPAELKRVS